MIEGQHEVLQEYRAEIFRLRDLKTCQKTGEELFPGRKISSRRHRDKTRVQMPAKIFPHLKVKC